MKDTRDKHVTSLDVKLRLSKELTELLARKEDEGLIDSICEDVASFFNDIPSYETINTETWQSTGYIAFPREITCVIVNGDIITDIQYRYKSIFDSQTKAPS